MSLFNSDALLAAEAALRRERLITKIPDAEKLTKKELMSQLLDQNSLSLPDIVENLNVIAKSAEKEELRFKANELALKLHGALADESQSKTPTININVIGEEVSLGFLQPQVGYEM